MPRPLPGPQGPSALAIGGGSPSITPRGGSPSFSVKRRRRQPASVDGRRLGWHWAGEEACEPRAVDPRFRAHLAGWETGGGVQDAP